MRGATMTPGVEVSARGPWARLRSHLAAVGHGLGFSGLMLAGAVPLLALAVALMYADAGFRWLADLGQAGPDPSRIGLLPVLLIFASLCYVRPLTSLTRRLSARWCGVPIAMPYRPRPAAGDLEPWPQLRLRVRWLLTDPATWRDLLWLTVNVSGGFLLAAAPVGLVLYGVTTTVARAHLLPIAPDGSVGMLLAKGMGAVPLAIALIMAGIWMAPRLLRGYGRLARLMLGPAGRVELETRVRHLTRSRSEYIDTGAAELRRIERDLHDGAQARLVAMGMTLEAAQQQLETSPAAARALLAEAKRASVQVLAELRDIVRGIHPPVLADRGLSEAVRAIALNSQPSVCVTTELAGRPPAPVESAAYFAVSELLANVSKHSAASQAWIDLRYSGGMLRISVTDDGIGGADPRVGTGLSGIERRLAAFDGVVALLSPPGGPTTVNLEIPCELSSPKTSSC
jgi:signal transduction histidine kinase